LNPTGKLNAISKKIRQASREARNVGLEVGVKRIKLTIWNKYHASGHVLTSLLAIKPASLKAQAAQGQGIIENYNTVTGAKTNSGHQSISNA